MCCVSAIFLEDKIIHFIMNNIDSCIATLYYPIPSLSHQLPHPLFTRSQRTRILGVGQNSRPTETFGSFVATNHKSWDCDN